MAGPPDGLYLPCQPRPPCEQHPQHGDCLHLQPHPVAARRASDLQRMETDRVGTTCRDLETPHANMDTMVCSLCRLCCHGAPLITETERRACIEVWDSDAKAFGHRVDDAAALRHGACPGS